MADLSQWVPPIVPPRDVILGRFVTLEPLKPSHIDGLFEAYSEDKTGEMWRYLPVGPHDRQADYARWFEEARLTEDPLQFAVRMQDGRLGGTLSLMRISPSAGSIETGWLTFSPRLQRTREATEAVYRLMEWSFNAGYRRFEWKCNAENLASRRAAQRFGFSFEGVFRQAAVSKGKNRDTAWFAAIDAEWPALKTAFETWLDPTNFDPHGQQRQTLGGLTAPIRVADDPALLPS